MFWPLGCTPFFFSFLIATIQFKKLCFLLVLQVEDVVALSADGTPTQDLDFSALRSKLGALAAVSIITFSPKVLSESVF